MSMSRTVPLCSTRSRRWWGVDAIGEWRRCRGRRELRKCTASVSRLSVAKFRQLLAERLGFGDQEQTRMGLRRGLGVASAAASNGGEERTRMIVWRSVTLEGGRG